MAPLNLHRRDGEKPLNVIIVGGSLTGLMHGVMLKRHGHHVRILEQSLTSLREGQAAGIGLQGHASKFMEKYDLVGGAYGNALSEVRFFDRDCSVLKSIPLAIESTSWDVMYYRLRANFDGYASSYCPKPPQGLPNDGRVEFEIAKQVSDLEYDSEVDKVIVRYEDLLSRERLTATADLVLGADGGYSRLRRILLPGEKLDYTGWIAWRGLVPESLLSQDARDLYLDGMCTTTMGGTYTLSYTIPGESGTLEPGKRMFNVAWYENMDEDSKALRDALTDSEGHKHFTTLPPGKMASAIWKKQLAFARTVMPKPLLEAVEKFEQPFLTACYDSAAVRASFFDSRVLLLGSALAQFCPNRGLAMNESALNCLELEQVLLGEKTIQQWEEIVIKYGTEARDLSFAHGARLLGKAGARGLTMVGDFEVVRQQSAE